MVGLWFKVPQSRALSVRDRPTVAPGHCWPVSHHIIIISCSVFISLLLTIFNSCLVSGSTAFSVPYYPDEGVDIDQPYNNPLLIPSTCTSSYTLDYSPDCYRTPTSAQCPAWCLWVQPLPSLHNPLFHHSHLPGDLICVLVFICSYVTDQAKQAVI